MTSESTHAQSVEIYSRLYTPGPISGGHTGGASGAVHQGPRPLGAHQRGPDSNFLKNYYYAQESKCGITIKREWLCYSPKLNKVYCQPCCLFAVEPSPSGRSGSNTLISGYDDWRHLSRVIKIHQESKAHIEACRVQETWRANRLIDDALDSVAKTEETYWRRVLDRIVNVTLTLAQGNMPFRGHRENDTELQ